MKKIEYNCNGCEANTMDDDEYVSSLLFPLFVKVVSFNALVGEYSKVQNKLIFNYVNRLSVIS